MKPFKNSDLEQIFKQTQTIAVVGLSDKTWRDSYRVARYLQTAGFKIYPVNPALGEVLGEKAYPDLLSLPEPVDLVNVFRRPEEVPALVEQAIALPSKALWLQFGVIHHEAAKTARAAGLGVVMDRCIMIDHAEWKRN